MVIYIKNTNRGLRAYYEATIYKDTSILGIRSVTNVLISCDVLGNVEYHSSSSHELPEGYLEKMMLLLKKEPNYEKEIVVRRNQLHYIDKLIEEES